ncbi:MAG: DUF3169 family protein [Clostridium sp.]|nr:DUF3169 family protein [Clostridium sp.]MCM1399213.1 DUF3169 family protein [Clostridium sp.]MCM1459235.1 DUF3169 family protein [Bacteroides sp.]
MREEPSETQKTLIEYEERNKKEDKKSFKPFIIIMVICFIVGIGVGKAAHVIEDNLEAIRAAMEQIEVVLAYVLPSVFLFINIVELIVVFGMVHRQEKRLDEWDGVEEEVLDDIERKLDFPANCTNVMQILGMFLFAACIHIDLSVELPKNHEMIIFWIVIIDFMASLIICIMLQKRMVNLVKVMNPEKNGSIYDMDFNKKWEESCDEAQKMVIYRSSYKAFRVSNMMCCYFWVLGIVADFAFHTGLFPIVVVLLIWLVQVLVYSRETTRLERGGK